MARVSRREFIRIAGAGTAGAAGLAAGSGLVTDWWGLDPNVVHDPNTDGDRVVPTFCELCFWKCGVLAHVKNGRVTKITGNPQHPLSRGRLCPRGTGGMGLLYDPDRLKQPLVRVEKRGAQSFEPVSWDDALNEVAGQMTTIRERYGPEAMALYMHGYGGSWFKHLFKAYGSPNITAPSYAQCRGPREVGFQLTFGSGVGSPENTDLEHARVITLIGSHLGENMHNTQVQDFARALDRGAELVVVDPRYSTAAGKARYWLPIKPGTDLALLLAWTHVIVNEGLYDHAYLDRYAIGLDELKAHVADKTPEWAFTHTTIRPEVIVETARFIAGGRPSSLVHPGRHVTWYGDDTQRTRAIAILTALLGAWGRKGGYYFPAQLEVPKYSYARYTGSARPPADMPRDTMYPLADATLASGVCDATIPGHSSYDIKGWMVYGSNLIQSLPDPEKTKRALQELDFVTVVDVLPMEIVGWADVVLPEATYLERCDEIHNPPYKEPFLAVRQPVVEPMYESKPGWWIAREIAHRIGLESYFPWADSTEYAKQRLRDGGYDCDLIQATGVAIGEHQPIYIEEGIEPTFATPSGKIELHSAQLAAMGFDPIPEFTPPEEPPPGHYRLLFGRSPVHTFGRTTNNRFLSEIERDNHVWLNAQMAEEQGLSADDWVTLVNQDDVRSEPIRVRVTQRIRTDCVYMVHGYGHDAKGLSFARGRGASDSKLVTRYKTDPLMGGTGMNVNFVRLEPVANEGRSA